MAAGSSQDNFAEARQRMVKFDLQGRDINDPDVLKVLGEIPREEFVLGQYLSQAYADGPLPIGMGQTISQPYIVALMTQALKLRPDFEVLEIGTGSGYQTAVLSRLVKKVYTIERHSELSESAQAVLGRLGFTNIVFFVGDGSSGWPEKREFDGIIVTAAVPEIQGPLLEQVRDCGLIIAPVGSGGVQRLVVFEKKAGRCTEKVICDVRFVKLIGEFGFNEVE